MADINIQRLVPFPAAQKSDTTIRSDGSVNGVKTKVVNTNGSPITLKEGVIVDVPQSLTDKIGEFLAVITNNWQLAVIGVVAIFVLIKD